MFVFESQSIPSVVDSCDLITNRLNLWSVKNISNERLSLQIQNSLKNQWLTPSEFVGIFTSYMHCDNYNIQANEVYREGHDEKQLFKKTPLYKFIMAMPLIDIESFKIAIQLFKRRIYDLKAELTNLKNNPGQPPEPPESIYIKSRRIYIYSQDELDNIGIDELQKKQRLKDYNKALRIVQHEIELFYATVPFFLSTMPPGAETYELAIVKFNEDFSQGLNLNSFDWSIFFRAHSYENTILFFNMVSQCNIALAISEDSAYIFLQAVLSHEVDALWTKEQREIFFEKYLKLHLIYNQSFMGDCDFLKNLQSSVRCGTKKITNHLIENLNKIRVQTLRGAFACAANGFDMKTAKIILSEIQRKNSLLETDIANILLSLIKSYSKTIQLEFSIFKQPLEELMLEIAEKYGESQILWRNHCGKLFAEAIKSKYSNAALLVIEKVSQFFPEDIQLFLKKITPYIQPLKNVALIITEPDLYPVFQRLSRVLNGQDQYPLFKKIWQCPQFLHTILPDFDMVILKHPSIANYLRAQLYSNIDALESILMGPQLISERTLEYMHSYFEEASHENKIIMRDNLKDFLLRVSLTHSQKPKHFMIDSNISREDEADKRVYARHGFLVDFTENLEQGSDSLSVFDMNCALIVDVFLISQGIQQERDKAKVCPKSSAFISCYDRGHAANLRKHLNQRGCKALGVFQNWLESSKISEKPLNIVYSAIRAERSDFILSKYHSEMNKQILLDIESDALALARPKHKK